MKYLKETKDGGYYICIPSAWREEFYKDLIVLEKNKRIEIVDYSFTPQGYLECIFKCDREVAKLFDKLYKTKTELLGTCVRWEFI